MTIEDSLEILRVEARPHVNESVGSRGIVESADCQLGVLVLVRHEDGPFRHDLCLVLLLVFLLLFELFQLLRSDFLLFDGPELG